AGADELGLAWGERPAVPAGHHDLGIDDVGDAQQRGPLARSRPGAQVRTGIGEERPDGRGRFGLDVSGVVIAERGEEALLVRRRLGDGVRTCPRRVGHRLTLARPAVIYRGP